MRLLLVVNPSASSVTPRGKIAVEEAFSGAHDITVVETNRRGHATKLAAGAANDGYDGVAVLGGDGTLNEAANGLAGTDAALIPLPGGSTNVFARTIGLPTKPEEAARVQLDALAGASIRSVGLGSVNGRYFLFHVGMGFDAAVVAQVERRAGLKRYAGHPLFIYCTVATWLRHYDRSRPRFKVLHKDGTSIEDAYFAICMNTNPYTFLGSRPFDLAAEATLESGLVLVTLKSLAFSQILHAAVAALAGHGKLAELDHVELHTDLEGLTIEGHGPFPYQVDGDYLGEIEHLELRHEPHVLRLVMPPEERPENPEAAADPKTG